VERGNTVRAIPQPDQSPSITDSSLARPLQSCIPAPHPTHCADPTASYRDSLTEQHKQHHPSASRISASSPLPPTKQCHTKLPRCSSQNSSATSSRSGQACAYVYPNPRLANPPTRDRTGKDKTRRDKMISDNLQDPAAALALVSARPSSSSSSSATTSEQQGAQADADADLSRAQELVALHYEVREPCRRGELGRGLAEARSAVERALG
jgi:hypothetical protein